MVVMHVIGLTVDTSTKIPLVVLQDSSGHEILPIWIGAMEAVSISLALSGGVLPRPLTHDLLLRTLQALGGRLDAVEINALHEGTYHADAVITHDGGQLRLDCRPSDGIALALRAEAPVRVSLAVLHAAAEARLRPSQYGEAHMVKPEDLGTDMIRLVSGNTPPTHENTDTASRPASVTPKEAHDLAALAREAALLPGAALAADEQTLAELLQKLEPASSRRM